MSLDAFLQYLQCKFHYSHILIYQAYKGTSFLFIRSEDHIAKILYIYTCTQVHTYGHMKDLLWEYFSHLFFELQQQQTLEKRFYEWLPPDCKMEKRMREFLLISFSPLSHKTCLIPHYSQHTIPVTNLHFIHFQDYSFKNALLCHIWEVTLLALKQRLLKSESWIN